jgi:hypothetical protein
MPGKITDDDIAFGDHSGVAQLFCHRDGSRRCRFGENTGELAGQRLRFKNLFVRNRGGGPL